MEVLQSFEFEVDEFVLQKISRTDVMLNYRKKSGRHPGPLSNNISSLNTSSHVDRNWGVLSRGENRDLMMWPV